MIGTVVMPVRHDLLGFCFKADEMDQQEGILLCDLKHMISAALDY